MTTSLPLVFDEPRRAKKPPRHLADLSGEERRTAVAALGEPAFRARQLSNHYFARLTDDPADMTDLPAATRDKLVAELMPPLLTKVRDLECDNGTTRKSLWKLLDGSLVESVLMRYKDRTTMCVSSQAGCGMACPFCATGQAGLTRNMSTAEIVEQVVDGARALSRGEIAGGPGRVNNIVFMGMGEPMANYKAVIGAVRRFTEPSPDGLGISARGVTVSTVGLVPRINQLSTEGIPVTLALSLHAPDDELRDELVPINNRWKVDEVLDAAWGYAQKTKRRVSIEYAMIRDINDHAWRADLLAEKLAARGDWGWVHVNLIPLNPTPGSKWTASDPADEREFVRRLQAGGIPTTVRDTRGQEIDGACGQLAAANKDSRRRHALHQQLVMAELFSRVRWREGYDIAEVEAFIERLEATVEGRYVERPVTADEIRNVSFTPVRLREGYAVDEVDAFLDHAAQSMTGRPVDQAGGAPGAWPADRPVDRPSAHPAGDRRLRDAPRFTPVKFSEGYDMSEVDDFVDRVMATVNGLPVDRPVTAREIDKVQFTPVRFREGYDVMEVDLFLEEAERWLTGS